MTMNTVWKTHVMGETTTYIHTACDFLIFLFCTNVGWFNVPIAVVEPEFPLLAGDGAQEGTTALDGILMTWQRDYISLGWEGEGFS